jgi:hypothetical protein
MDFVSNLLSKPRILHAFVAGWTVPYGATRIASVRVGWPLGVVVLGDGEIEATARGIAGRVLPSRRIEIDARTTVRREPDNGGRRWQSFTIRSDGRTDELMVFFRTPTAARFQTALTDMGVRVGER